jgi:hypothetical protein
MEQSYKLIAKLKDSKDSHTEWGVIDYVMTEESIRNNFSKLFDSDCDIFARLLYIKMAKCKDLCQLTFIDFVNFFVSFYVRKLNFNCFRLTTELREIDLVSRLWTSTTKTNWI